MRWIRWLGGRRVSAYLFLAYAVFLAFLMVWAGMIPSMVVQAISRLAPFWIIYLVAGAHLLTCIVLFWPMAMRRISLQRPTSRECLRVDLTADGAEAFARAARLRLRWLEPRAEAVLHRHRFSPLGTLFFHAALLLLPVAFGVSRATYFRGDGLIIEGHAFDGSRSAYATVEPEDEFEARAPELQLDIKGVEASFWGERLFFTDLRALVTARHDGGERTAWITVEDPIRVAGSRITIRGYNYTPAIELTDPTGTVLYAGDLNLRLFPLPLEDSFVVPSLPHRIFVRLLPHAPPEAETRESQGYALGQPLFHVAVTRGKRLVTHGWLRIGEPLAFDGYQLRFTAIRRGGDLLVVRDHGYPILWLALILMLAGAAWRILWPSRRVWISWKNGDAEAVVSEDPFVRRPTAGLFAQRGSDER